MSTIITIEELETYTGETLDADRAAQVVDAVNDYVEQVTGRCWGEIKTVDAEVHDFASVVFLRHPDVTEIVSVKRGKGSGTPTTLNTSSYTMNPYGRLVLSDGRIGFQSIRDYISVKYNHGVVTVPADLKLSALALAADFYTYSSEGNKEVTSEQVGTYKLSYASGSRTGSGMALNDNFNRYRVRSV